MSGPVISTNLQKVERICSECGLKELVPIVARSPRCFACQSRHKSAKALELAASMTPTEKHAAVMVKRTRQNAANLAKRAQKALEARMGLVTLSDADPTKRDTCVHYAGCRLTAAKKVQAGVCPPGCTFFKEQPVKRLSEDDVWCNADMTIW